MRYLPTLGVFLSLTLVACGDDDAPAADASPFHDSDLLPPDAAPPCPTCDYAPEPLTAGEIPAAEQLALAQRFNPAHVYTNAVVFASPVDYVLEQGGPLMRAKVLQTGPFWKRLDLAAATEVTGIGDLMTVDWSDLPLVDGQGNEVAYFIDTPGDSTGPAIDEETWTAAWTAAGGPDYPPTQYAHLFWLSKAEGYLAIQYWFFFPFDKFANSHEADWEHINVIVQQQPGGDWSLVMAHYSAHGLQAGLAADQIVRVTDEAAGGNGDHPVVFTGGSGCQMFGAGTPEYCGDSSGASLPYPGFYPTFSTPEVVAGGTTRAGRAIHANDHTVVLLPRLDEPVPAKLSWYKLPFMAGQPETDANAPATKATNSHRAPLPPNTYHYEFESAVPMPFDPAEGATLERFDVPAGWTIITDPTAGF